MAIPFSHVDSFFLRVSSIEKAIEWYSRVLECKTIWHNNEGSYAAIDVLGLPITFVEKKDNTELPYVHAPFNIYVDNIEEAHGYLKEHEVEVGEIEKLYNAEWFWFKDMDGNRLEVCSYHHSHKP